MMQLLVDRLEPEAPGPPRRCGPQVTFIADQNHSIDQTAVKEVK